MKRWDTTDWQYKFKVKERNSKWIMTVQGSLTPKLEVSQWRFTVNKAIEQLK